MADTLQDLASQLGPDENSLVGKAIKLWRKVAGLIDPTGLPAGQLAPGFQGGLEELAHTATIGQIPKTKMEWGMAAAPLLLPGIRSLTKQKKTIPGKEPMKSYAWDSSLDIGQQRHSWSDRPLNSVDLGWSDPVFGREYKVLDSPINQVITAPKQVPNNPTFFSNVLEAFENPKIPNKLSREQALAVLKSPGVKSEELKWLGMEEFLKGKQKFTKQEIADWVRDNQVDVHEIKSNTGADTNFASPGVVENGAFDSKYSQYTLPGGENYREVLLQWGNKPKATQQELIDGVIKELDLQRIPGDPPRWEGRFGDHYYYEHDLARMAEQKAPPNVNFTTGHFDQPNILAHFRLKDRVTPDGKKVLFVEEVQSDWQKKLRAMDKAGQDPTTTWDYKASKILHEKGLGEHAPYTKEQVGYYNEAPNPLVEEALGLGRELGIDYVPNAPLARDYPALAMKRILRMAAEEGYDAIGWTTGQQQAKRYNQAMLGAVDKLDYDLTGQKLTAWKDGKEIQSFDAPVSRLPELVGQEAAEKLLSQVEPVDSLKSFDQWKKHYFQEDGNPEGGWRDRTTGQPFDNLELWQIFNDPKMLGDSQRKPTPLPASIDSPSLTVGERGYADVYDKQLRQIADKIGKQFGARSQSGKVKIGNKQVPAYPGSPIFIQSTEPFLEDIHLFPITPTLRSTSQSKGFPLFTLAPIGLGLSAATQYLNQQKEKKQQKR
jgi:hypothetical protein